VLALLALGGVARAERPVLTVPAAKAPKLDGKLDEPQWKEGALFEISRSKDSFGAGRILRSGRQLYIGYKSEFMPDSLGIRLHFSDPATGRRMVVLVTPLELPRAPMSLFLERRADPPSRMDASLADVRFDYAHKEGFAFELRIPLDLIEIGRPKKAFAFEVELWDTQAQRPLAYYPMPEGVGLSRAPAAKLEPAKDWGADHPADAPQPGVHPALALMERIAAERAADPEAPGKKIEVIAAFLGTLDGKRRDEPLAKIEARLRELIKAYPDYAALRAHLVRVLIGRNRPAEALKVMESMRRDYPSLARGESQMLGEIQLLRDSGRFADALKHLEAHKELLGRLPFYHREYAQIDSMRRGWQHELAYRNADAARDDLPRVRIDTNRGSLVVELFEDDAPNAVANFITLVERGFYDGTRFHWSTGGASLFGGDPDSRDDDPFNDGYGGPGYMIETEPSRRLNFQGTLAFVPGRRRAWTEGSNFCIHMTPATNLDVRSTVFGRVLEGMEIARRLGYYDTLKKATVLRKREHAYKVAKRPE
jgi:cyclophilin family peptidyl-prolyl cis-trans isomerase